MTKWRPSCKQFQPTNTLHLHTCTFDWLLSSNITNLKPESQTVISTLNFNKNPLLKRIWLGKCVGLFVCLHVRVYVYVGVFFVCVVRISGISTLKHAWYGCLSDRDWWYSWEGSQGDRELSMKHITLSHSSIDPHTSFQSITASSSCSLSMFFLAGSILPRAQSTIDLYEECL